MSRHSSSAALTRRSSTSTVISTSRYEPDTASYRDVGVREVPDDNEGAVVMGECLFKLEGCYDTLLMSFARHY